MTIQSIKELEFLIGKWHGVAHGPVAEDGKKLTATAAFNYEPGKQVISGYRENREGKKLENRIIMVFLYDKKLHKLVRKDIYSYGFIVNQVGILDHSRYVFDSTGIDSEPEYYRGIGFRTYVEKISKDQVNMGVETAKAGEEYRLYVQQKLNRAESIPGN